MTRSSYVVEVQNILSQVSSSVEQALDLLAQGAQLQKLALQVTLRGWANLSGYSMSCVFEACGLDTSETPN